MFIPAVPWMDRDNNSPRTCETFHRYTSGNLEIDVPFVVSFVEVVHHHPEDLNHHLAFRPGVGQLALVCSSPSVVP